MRHSQRGKQQNASARFLNDVLAPNQLNRRFPKAAICEHCGTASAKSPADKIILKVKQPIRTPNCFEPVVSFNLRLEVQKLRVVTH
jgi:hypothetical protein